MPVTAGYLMPHPPVLIREVGNGRERGCEKTITGYAQAALHVKGQAPDTIVVITPHGPLFTDGLAIGGEPVLHGNLKAFGAPEVSVERTNAVEWVERIIYEAGKIDVPVVRIDRVSARTYGTTTELDHGVQVPLYFINQQWKNYRLIHITYGLLSIPRLFVFGQLLKRLFNEAQENIAVIASGDLSHCLKDDGPYAFHPDGPRFDEAAMGFLKDGDFAGLLTMDSALVKNAGECAYRSLAILGGVLDGTELESTCYSYEGPFGVGYGVCSFAAKGHRESGLHSLEEAWGRAREIRRSNEDPWVKLARATVEAFIVSGRTLEIPEGLPPAMRKERYGVFVSIKGPGGLRGCIGTFAPTTDSVAHEIVANAVKASTEDPRFPPIEEDELEDLTISVDVLMPSEPIRSKAELDPKRYGVIVQKGMKRGLLLPDLEGVDTAEEQIRIALQKAGIMESEDYTLQRFEVIRHH